jgi:hypothetical protein
MSKVLNRPMFNAHNSAYGRGITSNLVTEEQRQRFNDGGRVGMFWGGVGAGAMRAAPWATKMWSRLKPTGKFRIPKTTEGVLPGKYKPAPYTWGEMIKSPSILAKGIKENPWWTAAGGVGLTSDPVAAVTKGVAKALPATGKWAAEALTPGRFEKYLPWVKEEADKNKELVMTAEDVEKIGKTGAEQVVDKTTDTLDWTDEEKTEKKGQIQLKLAQRLVGGARDKWGSAKQMKNLGDWFGDVAAIGDKTELRKEERKYQAWAKAKKEISRDIQASEKEYGNLLASMNESQALKVSTGGKLNAVQLPREKKARANVAKNLSKGDVIFDESINAFSLAGLVDENGRAIAVPKEKLIDVQEKFLQQGA